MRRYDSKIGGIECFNKHGIKISLKINFHEKDSKTYDDMCSLRERGSLGYLFLTNFFGLSLHGKCNTPNKKCEACDIFKRKYNNPENYLNCLGYNLIKNNHKS